jgi:hypothetical protein
VDFDGLASDWQFSDGFGCGSGRAAVYRTGREEWMVMKDVGGVDHADEFDLKRR